jgi:hypothetical protein
VTDPGETVVEPALPATPSEPPTGSTQALPSEPTGPTTPDPPATLPASQVLTPLSPVTEKAAPSLALEKVLAPQPIRNVMGDSVPPLAPKYALPGVPATPVASDGAPTETGNQAPSRGGGGPAPGPPDAPKSPGGGPSVGGGSAGGAFFAGTLFAALFALLGLGGPCSRRLREAAAHLRPQAYIALLERPG